MSQFVAVVARDMRIALAEGGTLGTVLGFYLVVVAITPFAVGPDLPLLARIAPGMLWLALLLSSLLSLDRLFHADHEDGSLEMLALSGLPLELVVVGKCLAHWLTTALPLLLITPLLGLMLNLPGERVPVLLAAMALGSLAASFLGSIGAALTIGLRRGGLLVALIMLPLYVPLVIFALAAVDADAGGPGSVVSAFAILGGLTLGAMALAPLAAAAAIRLGLD